MDSTAIFPFVAKPGRYLGKEYNAVCKDWDNTGVKIAFIFPDMYEIGMSHLGLQILYHIINAQDDMLAERCFCPDTDAERQMRDTRLPLFSLESKKPLAAFDILGITLPYELCYTNILTILDLAGIPRYQKDRDESSPLIIGGGSCSLNPEPVADFFDAIVLGDGEEVIIEFTEAWNICQKKNLSKEETLIQLAQIEGVYIPSHYTIDYTSKGRIAAIRPQKNAPEKVKRRILKDLDDISHLYKPLVPNAKTIHDRLGLEIARGCTRGCRFCQAGMIYRPVRERSVDSIMEMAIKGIDNSGFEELALLSLSTGDYSCIDHLLPQIMDKYAEKYVSVSMPSMRVGTLSQQVMDQIKRVRKTGFTVAPEAGSERMRQVINKGITEEDLLNTCKDAFSLGWNVIKLYFMIGLPTETAEDIRAISALSQKILDMAKSGGGRSKQVTSSVGTFVPKPHTPFQWERQITLEESREKISLLRKTMPGKGVRLKYHDPKTSFLEGVFSRGDRRLSAVIEKCWQDGARFDSWSDHFNLARWHHAAEQTGCDLEFYLRQRDTKEILPWSHLDSGIAESFLLSERERSKTGEYTPDCRYNACQKCGLCDFSSIKPIVINRKRFQEEIKASDLPETSKFTKREDAEIGHFKYMVRYARRGDICYLGHLELLQILFRAIRRAKITTNFSQGFNPSPKISFGPALPVGMESEDEYIIMDLPAPLKSPSRTCKKLNGVLPDGLEVHEITLHNGKIPQTTLTTYSVDLNRQITEVEQQLLTAYQKSSTFAVTRIRKGKKKEIDIRPFVEIIQNNTSTGIQITVLSATGIAGVKVREALAAILKLPEKEILQALICKLSWQDADEQLPRKRER